jgi:hypothetical protein
VYGAIVLPWNRGAAAPQGVFACVSAGLNGKNVHGRARVRSLRRDPPWQRKDTEGGNQRHRNQAKEGIVKFKQIRNAAILIDFGGKRILVDPMLSEKGAFPGFEGTVNSRVPNPRVDLPVSNFSGLFALAG